MGSNVFVDFDVSALVTAEGTFSFALVADSSDALRANSKEAASNRPQLIVTF